MSIATLDCYPANSLRLINLSTGTLEKEVQIVTDVHGLACSQQQPAGSASGLGDELLAIATYSGTEIRLAASLELIAQLETGYTLTAAFSPDKTRLVTGGRDGCLRLFDCTSFSLLAVGKEHRVGELCSFRAVVVEPDDLVLLFRWHSSRLGC